MPRWMNNPCSAVDSSPDPPVGIILIESRVLIAGLQAERVHRNRRIAEDEEVMDEVAELLRQIFVVAAYTEVDAGR